MSHIHRRRISLPEFQEKKRKMDNPSISSRFRNKLSFVFFFLFVFWYVLLRGFDWSSLPVLTSKPSSHNQENPIQSIIPTEESGADIRLTNRHQEDEERSLLSSHVLDSGKSRSSGINETGSGEKVESEEEDVIREVGDLEKELEPILMEDDSRYAALSEDENDKKNPCNGRYIYVHELPSRFNQDLLKQCKLLNQWHDMCKYLENNGLGADLGNPGKIFSRTCWFNTNQFSLEVIFHNRMKQYDCLTNDSSKAAAIFVPYYAGLDVSRYLWGSSNRTMKDADSLGLAKWLREKPEWDSMSGRDHFMVAGRITWDFRRGVDKDNAWGNKLMMLPETKNMTILTIESSPWHRNDFAIPYPTYFHPWNDNDIEQWQNRMRKLKRKSLFCFAGGPRPDMPESIREQIMEQCRSAKRKCTLMECTNSRNKCQKPDLIMKMFQNSVFCLQPPGDSFTRRSTFDSILAGCIPVFFSPASAYVQYIWHLPKDYTKYSVLIPEEQVKNKAVSIDNILSRIPISRVAAMREQVIKLIPSIVYADPRSRLKRFEDAFDLTVKGMIQKVNSLRNEIQEGTNSSISFDEEQSWKYYTFGTVKKHEWDRFFLRKNKALY